MFYFTYKCRLCGVKFKQGKGCDEEYATEAMESVFNKSEMGMEISPTILHKCPIHLDIGIADLIGSEFHKDK